MHLFFITTLKAHSNRKKITLVYYAYKLQPLIKTHTSPR